MVPLTMPSMRCTPLTIIDSRSTRITGNGGAHAGLEAQLDALPLGLGEELFAVARQQLLVGRDHRLAGAQQFEHVAAGGFDAAHDLGHHGDRGVVAQAGEIGGEQARGRLGVSLGIAHQRCGHLDRAAGDPFDRRRRSRAAADRRRSRRCRSPSSPMVIAGMTAHDRRTEPAERAHLLARRDRLQL